MSYATGLIAAICAAFPQVALAQDDPALAGVGEAADAAELIPSAAAGLPPILPGQEPGARSKPTDGSVAPAAREWFGQSPWIDWTRATGDWSEWRTELEKVGIAFNGALVSEWSDVLDGGVGGSSAFRHLLDLNLGFDLETIAGVRRATVFVDFQTGNTGHGAELDGAFQTYSNIAIDGSITQLSQLWYEQWFADDALRVKVGKVDANSEFAYIPAAGGFLNASSGFTPALFTLPTYPNPSMSVNLFVYPCEGAYLGAGVYDGATAVDGVQTGALGPGGFFSDDPSDDWFVIGEMGYTVASLGALDSARVAVGAWWHSGDFPTFAGGTEDGTSGLYALAEARAWRPEGVAAGDSDDTRGLWFFLQYGSADEHVSAVRAQYGAGASLSGTLAGRDDDALGLYLSSVDFSNDPAAALGASELAVELYYDLALTPSVHLKPDLQWYSNLAGGGDGVVGTLRVILSF